MDKGTSFTQKYTLNSFFNLLCPLMNHLNCFVIEAIAKQLQKRAKGSILLDCFSNSPDEITFIFDSISFKCLFFQAEVYFSFDDTDISKSRLFKPQFSELIESRISNIEAHVFERSFQMVFESGSTLVFKCHGRKSNILLFDQSNFSDMFRKIWKMIPCLNLIRSATGYQNF